MITEFSRAGLTFPVRDEGPADGPAVVLLHGFPAGPESFDDVVPLLHEHGLRTLVPRQRGYAPRARPAGRRAYAIQELTDDVLALLDAADLQRAHLVGHDWGGGPAWLLAADHPDRLASLTVVSAPHPRALAASMVRSGQALRSWYMAFFQLPALPERILPRRLRASLVRGGLPERFADGYVAAMSEPGALTGALNWYRGIPFSRGSAGPARVPTTYVWGRDDFALGRWAAEATARYANADYRFVELAAGHWLPEACPADVAAAVVDRVRSTSR